MIGICPESATANSSTPSGCDFCRDCGFKSARTEGNGLRLCQPEQNLRLVPFKSGASIQ